MIGKDIARQTEREIIQQGRKDNSILRGEVGDRIAIQTARTRILERVCPAAARQRIRAGVSD